MKYVIMHEIKRCICSPITVLTVLVGVIMLLLPLWGDLTGGGIRELPHLYYIQKAHVTGPFDIFAPVLAVLPASGIFCEEYKSGFVKFILVRTNKLRYILNKMIVCTIVGGATTLIPVFVLSVVSMIIGKPYLQSDVSNTYSTLFENTIFENLQFQLGGLWLIIILIGISFLFGMTWSSVGLCISAFLPNKYLTFSLPYILYFTLFVLLYNIKGAIMFSPVNMMFPNVDFIPSIFYVICYQGVIFVLSMILFGNRALKRLII